MSTIVTDEFRNSLFGGGTHSQPDFPNDTTKAAILDATDANGGVALTAANVVDYADINDADVIDTATVSVSSVTDGVVVLTGSISFTGTTGVEDDGDYIAVYKEGASAAVSPVWLIWDSASTGLPVSPTGSTITAALVDNELVSITAS